MLSPAGAGATAGAFASCDDWAGAVGFAPFEFVSATSMIQQHRNRLATRKVTHPFHHPPASLTSPSTAHTMEGRDWSRRRLVYRSLIRSTHGSPRVSGLSSGLEIERLFRPVVPCCAGFRSRPEAARTCR